MCIHVCMYVCMYVYLHIYMYASLSLYIYIYRERERERDAVDKQCFPAVAPPPEATETRQTPHGGGEPTYVLSLCVYIYIYM